MWIHTGPEIIKWKCQVPSAEGRGNPVSEWVLVSIKRDIFKKKNKQKEEGWGYDSMGKSTCHTCVRTGVQVPGVYINAKWAWWSVTPNIWEAEGGFSKRTG